MTPQLTAMVTVIRMLYPRSGYEAGDWCILLCHVDDVIEGEPYSDHTICVKGNAYTANLMTQYRLIGEYVNDSKYGDGYNIITFNKDCNLDDPDQQRIYLNTVCTQGQIKALYAAMPNPFEALKAGDIETITKAKGFGPTTATKVIDRFKSKLADSIAYVTLSQYGMSNESISTLLRKFTSAQELIDAIETNPYLMIDSVDGIGWKRADAIALSKGIGKDSVNRIKAYIEYRLNEDSNNGDTWTTPDQLINATFTELEMTDQARFREALYEMHDVDETLWWNEEKSMVGLKRLRDLEADISHHLKRLSNAEPSIGSIFYDHGALKEIEEAQGWEFTEEQHAAIQMVLDNNVSIVTGAAGVGKSSVVSGVLKILGTDKFAQCALSGRAAARLTEVTGTPGRTIHRLLGYQGGTYLYNEELPLPYDIIILDEISMVGAEIFFDLIRAIHNGAKLIMLGDPAQLEAIGLCNLCNDMLKSSVIPVARLTKIHRQAAKSAIITESVSVREGKQITPMGWVGSETRGELQDLDLRVFSDSCLSQDTVIEEYTRLLQEGINPYDIQVVVPMRVRGTICTMELNKVIQKLVNPSVPGIEMVVTVKKQKSNFNLAVKDRVIVTKNTYDAVRYIDTDTYGDQCPVFNGDRGVIKEAHLDGLVIDFDLWGMIYLDAKQMKNVELGYALTCHKLQGSEAPYVIIGIDESAKVMLTKEWLYTAITRAKKHCVLCAQSSMLTYAISNSNVPIKRTMLKELLMDDFTSNDIVSTEVV